LNKLPLRRDEKGKLKSDVDISVIKKLHELGILYVSPIDETSAFVLEGEDEPVEDKNKPRNFTFAQLNHFYDFFKYHGRKIRSVTFPFVGEIRDGRFSVQWGEKQEIHHYPYLVDLVEGNNFEVPAYANPTQRVYMFGLRELTNFVVSHSGLKPRRNYVKRKNIFDRVKLTSEATLELKDFLYGYYSEDSEKYGQHVREEKYGCSTTYLWVLFPKSFSLKTASKVLADIQTRINPQTQITEKEVEAALNPEDSSERRLNSEFRISSPEYHEIFTVHYNYSSTQMQLGFLRSSEFGTRFLEDLDSKKYLRYVDIFVEGLQRACALSSRRI
jgi:hypothetical protein